MMKFLLTLLSIAVMAAGFAADPVKLPPKEKFLLVLLAGQSNMAGRGFVQDSDKIPSPRVVMLDKEGNWVPAVDPVHYDKKAAGVGPGRTFANLLAATDPEITVGLIPTACGGSPISSWVPGGYWEQTKRGGVRHGGLAQQAGGQTDEGAGRSAGGHGKGAVPGGNQPDSPAGGCGD